MANHLPPSYASRVPDAAAPPRKQPQPATVQRHQQSPLPRRHEHSAHTGQRSPPPATTRRPVSSAKHKDEHGRGGRDNRAPRGEPSRATPPGVLGVAEGSFTPHVMQDLADPASAASRRYQRHPPGAFYSIALTNRGQTIRTDVVASDWVLVTRAIVSQHRAAKQCVHFSRNGACQRGSECSFVHLAPPPLMQPPMPALTAQPVAQPRQSQQRPPHEHRFEHSTASAAPLFVPRPTITGAAPTPAGPADGAPAWGHPSQTQFVTAHPPPPAYAAPTTTDVTAEPGVAPPAQGHSPPTPFLDAPARVDRQRTRQNSSSGGHSDNRTHQQQLHQPPLRQQRFRHAAYDATPVSPSSKRPSVLPNRAFSEPEA